MVSPARPVLQSGIPPIIPDVIGIAATLVLALMLVAAGGALYKHMTGGIEWPADREPDDDEVRRSHDDDDEWKYH